MTNSGGFAVSRSHRGDRFYNPPPMRRQLQKAAKAEAAASEVGNRTGSHDSATALSKPQSVCSSSSAQPKNVTNLDRLMESVTPFVLAQHFSEVNVRGQRTREAGANAFFCLEDLWESFREWSAYGVGVPLLLNEKDQIIQYYVPFLSGIQLYIDPLKSSSWLRLGAVPDTLQ